jgi:putative membrane protein
MGGYYWDGPWHMWGGFGWLFPFLMVDFIFLCVYLLIRAPRGHARNATGSALRLLNERFAKGEISKEELEEKREFLLRSP